MKKVLLAGTALLGFAAISSPAAAEINLDLGGYFRGYAVFADNDETGTAASADDLRDFDFRRDTEIHFSGETTTDNGLTVGVHHEMIMGDDAGVNDTDETYMYVSGGMGRVNFGSEDGAAYLLQVAAPSADSNVDGMRVYIQALNANLWDDNALGAAGSASDGAILEYDHADFENTDRLTYLTPKWNGFQAGFSYAPEIGQNSVVNNVAAMATDDDAGDFEDLWELAARWDGEFEGFGISFGGGYSHASAENEAASGVGNVGSDDLTTWNAGLNVAFSGFSIGGAYTTTDNGVDNNAAGIDNDTDTWVVGVGYDNGPYHLGASYLDRNYDNGLMVSGNELDVERFAFGGGYTYGPGMTFRGAVAFGDTDNNTVGVADPDFTQVTLGTDVQF